MKKKNSKSNKIKVLCICAKGKNRSKYLAGYLRRKGYSTRYGGVDDGGTEPILKRLKQKDVDWSDIIIVARKRHLPIFKEKYIYKNKKIIVLDVSDSLDNLPEEFAHLKKLKDHEFQLVWTWPRLRKAIKPYLPLTIK